MRRAWRIFVSAMTIGSLLLCLAFAVLWVRGYWRSDLLGWLRRPEPEGASYGFALGSSGGGVLAVVFWRAPVVVDWPFSAGWHWEAEKDGALGYADWFSATRWGFGRFTHDVGNARWDGLILPGWVPTILFAAVPLARGARLIRRRRRACVGLCKKCGYDLRATPDRCPECGTAPAAK